jgi:hypothetical protein
MRTAFKAGKRTQSPMSLLPREKPSFQQIRQQAKTTTGQSITRAMIAEQAGLPYGEVYLLDIAGHLPRAKIKKVLRAFNELSGIQLTEQDIKHGG